ncbi:hypothetical protein ACGFYV_25910 [Streptomyces sp. NPDC048297]|uniref:hypothetical protein n=1 Tax=Streptomyces sp. NPDC048297 TaxID=3365531 RepID=UPI00371CEB39
MTTAQLAAMLPEFGGSSVAGTLALPGQRGALRSVPLSGGRGDGGLEDPLRLGRTMRLRLRDAVQALLADPSIARLKDAPKLAAVVLYAKSRAPKGEKKDNQTSIWGAELGRWLGMKESTVHHKVLPVLRGTDALHTQVVTDAKGHPTGLDCLVMPLWNARKSEGAGHPLALTKAELATLLRLIEALFGPGWTPEGKEPTPPGLLAGRTGKGAATDRLGLLLMVLNTRASGWLQLCSGSVKKREGRGAATLARLLGCSPSGARKVLARLTEAGVVARQRKATSTRMNGRGKVMLLPVARAYGRILAPVEAVSGSGAVFSARPDGACGDHAPAGTAGALGTSGIGGAEQAGEAEDRERPDGAELHADHASVVTPVVPSQLSCGFSGAGRGAEGRRPERACPGEDQAADGESAVAKTGSPAAEDGPLRGEKPKKSPAVEVQGQVEVVDGGRVPLTVVGGGGRTRQRQAVGAFGDLRLPVVLAPVAHVWERLSGGQQAVVRRAVRGALRVLGGIADEACAPQLLADRLADRLEEAGGEALVRDPMGWLLGRGLVQRPACTDRRCDDGIRLDTRAECLSCAMVVADRRARRARLRAAVDARFEGVGVAGRRAVYEARLREDTALEAARTEARHARAAIEVEHRQAAAARRRQEEEAADLARRSAPCTECGMPEAAGLCPPCTHRQRTENLVREAVDLAVAVRADLNSPDNVAALTRRCEADSRALLADICRRTATEHGLEAFTAREMAERIRDERRASAYQRLLGSEEASAEADAVYDMVLRRRPGAHDAARKAAEDARHRTAEYLLPARLGQLRAHRARAEAGRLARCGG